MKSTDGVRKIFSHTGCNASRMKQSQQCEKKSRNSKVIKRWRFQAKRCSIKKQQFIKKWSNLKQHLFRDNSFFTDKCAGNIGEIMATGICILAMTVVMLSYLDSVQLIGQKMEVSQIARKYILRMETVGQLTAQDCTALTQELQEAGLTEIDFSGTTLSQVTYGNPITLQIQGKLRDEYVIKEQRVSTSKN